MTLEEMYNQYEEKMHLKRLFGHKPVVMQELKKAYLAGAEEVKADCGFALEGKDVEIMELKTENNKLLDVINNQDIKIADLEKENTELDMKRKAERKIFQGIVEKKNDQLTKAKDILRMIVYWKSDKKELLNFINKAKQFIKEIEK